MVSPRPSATLAGALLLDARHRAGLSQAELARRAGVARPLISQYENGHKDPSLTTLAHLVAACGLELRLSAEQLTEADRAQYARDEHVGVEQGRQNAARARSELLGLRRPGSSELAELKGL